MYDLSEKHHGKDGLDGAMHHTPVWTHEAVL
jgi:hypothetical protein